MTTGSNPRGLRATSVLRTGMALILAVVGCLLTALPTTSAAAPVPAALRLAHTSAAPHTIEVTGDKHAWHVRYPGRDGVLGTADDIRGRQNVHVPLGVPTRVVLHSRDYIYSLRVPSLKLNEVAIPNMEFELRIDARRAGRHGLSGGQMCGVSRPALQGVLVVQSVEDYWAALQGMETR